MSSRALENLARLAIPVGIAASLVQYSIYDVQGGMRAVIFDRLKGVKQEVVKEGTHFVVPWLQRPIIFDVRTKPVGQSLNKTFVSDCTEKHLYYYRVKGFANGFVDVTCAS